MGVSPLRSSATVFVCSHGEVDLYCVCVRGLCVSTHLPLSWSEVIVKYIYVCMCVCTHTHTHTHTHTYTHTHTHIHTHIHTHTKTHTHTHTENSILRSSATVFVCSHGDVSMCVYVCVSLINMSPYTLIIRKRCLNIYVNRFMLVCLCVCVCLCVSVGWDHNVCAHVELAQTHADNHSLSLFLSHTHSLIHTLSLIHTHSLSFSLSLSLCLCVSFSFSLYSLSLSFSHTH